MNTLITIVLILVGIIALLLVMATFMRKEHYVQRSIIINAPVQKVFDYIKLLRNQDEFNKHAMAGPDRKKEFKGTDGTVGFIYAWSGNKDAGEGEKEIKQVVEGKKVEMEIRFVKPMAVSASITLETEPLPDNQTKVYWTNTGLLKFPINIFIPMMEKNVAKDMDSSLSKLKSILEKQP